MVANLKQKDFASVSEFQTKFGLDQLIKLTAVQLRKLRIIALIRRRCNHFYSIKDSDDHDVVAVYCLPKKILC